MNQRSRAWLLLLAALIAAASGYAVDSGTPRHQALMVRVTSTQIPPMNSGYLSSAAGALWVYGERNDGGCVLSKIGRAPFAVVATTPASCAIIGYSPPSVPSLAEPEVLTTLDRLQFQAQYRLRWFEPARQVFTVGPVLWTANAWTAHRSPVTYGEGSLFLGDNNEGSGNATTVLQISASTGRILHRIEVPGTIGTYSLLAGSDGLFLSVWRTVGIRPAVSLLYRVPPGGDRLVPINLPRDVIAIATMMPTSGLPMVGMVTAGGNYAIAPLEAGGTQLGRVVTVPSWLDGAPSTGGSNGFIGPQVNAGIALVGTHNSDYWTLAAGAPLRPQSPGASLCNLVGEIVHVDLNRGVAEVVYHFPPGVVPGGGASCDAYSLHPGQGLVANNAFYFLGDSGPGGYQRLYRAQLTS